MVVYQLRLNQKIHLVLNVQTVDMSGIKMTQTIEITNITANRLRNYFPDMTPANAIRELFKIALNHGHLETVMEAHRSDNYVARFRGGRN